MGNFGPSNLKIINIRSDRSKSKSDKCVLTVDGVANAATDSRFVLRFGSLSVVGSCTGEFEHSYKQKIFGAGYFDVCTIVLSDNV